MHTAKAGLSAAFSADAGREDVLLRALFLLKKREFYHLFNYLEFFYLQPENKSYIMTENMRRHLTYHFRFSFMRGMFT